MNTGMGISLGIAMVGLVGCASQPKSYGSQGPGESWTIIGHDDPDLGKWEADQTKKRRWGWASQLVTSKHDGSLREFFVGPVAYAGEDPDSITVSYTLFAERPISGRLVFEAIPEPGAAIAEEWSEPVVRRVNMDGSYLFGDVILPQVKGPTESFTVRWVADPKSRWPTAAEAAATDNP